MNKKTVWAVVVIAVVAVLMLGADDGYGTCY